MSRSSKKFILLFVLSIFMIEGCFNKKSKQSEEELIEDDLLISNTQMEVDTVKTFLESSEPFYPLQETIEDIQIEMADLRARILDYESRVKSQNNSLESLNKIQFPYLTHEIELTNGALVQGTIVQENSDRMIVKTQIGQLTIDKSKIVTIRNIAPNMPEVKFEGDALDEIYPNHRIFSGAIYNEGFRRADFVRVIFKLWSEKTELVGIDSSFIDGTKFVYNSGVIADTALEPGYSANYEVHVQADSSLVRYVTREIKWDVFE